MAVTSAVNKFFHIPATYAGHIRYDKDLWQHFGQDTPVIHQGVSFNMRQDLEKITESILKAQAMEVG
jgi:hypothetical protein